eukprot:gene7121-447_t
MSQPSIKQTIRCVCERLQAAIGIPLRPENLRAAKYNQPESVIVQCNAMIEGYRRCAFFRSQISNVGSRELLIALAWILSMHESIMYCETANAGQILSDLLDKILLPGTSWNISQSDKNSASGNYPFSESQATKSGIEEQTRHSMRRLVSIIHRLRLGLRENAALSATYFTMKSNNTIKGLFAKLPCSSAHLRRTVSALKLLSRCLEKDLEFLAHLQCWWSWCCSVITLQSKDSAGNDRIPKVASIMFGSTEASNGRFVSYIIPHQRIIRLLCHDAPSLHIASEKQPLTPCQYEFVRV